MISFITSIGGCGQRAGAGAYNALGMLCVEPSNHEQSALTLRAKLIQEGKDPLEGIFHVTHEERCTIRLEPWSSPAVDHTSDRFCGLKLQVIG